MAEHLKQLRIALGVGLRKAANVITGTSIFLLLMAAFLVVSPEIQRESYGVLQASAGLALAVFAVLHHIGTRREFYSFSNLGEWADHRALIIAAAFALPILISAWHNGTVSAAINPKGYWTEQAKHLPDCEFWDSIVVSAADSARVSNNKFRMGIETKAALEASIQTLDFAQDQAKNCAIGRSVRKDELRAKLRALGVNVVVE